MSERSLSTYFRAGTTYFYGYPSDEDPTVYYKSDLVIEELMAMRAASCAGDHVRVLVFAATARERVLGVLRDDFGATIAPAEQLVVLPEGIDVGLGGARRDAAIQRFFRERLGGGVAMAQPFQDEALAPLFAVPPAVTYALSDKRAVGLLVPAAHVVPQHREFADGRAFQGADVSATPLPCVAKVSASCSGEGVHLCRSPGDLAAAQARFAASRVPVLLQDLVVGEDLDVLFAVPEDAARASEILGVAEQITSPEAGYVGGVLVPGWRDKPGVADICAVLREHVLPRLRARGWFGVGGVDVLREPGGRFFFIDFNLRMTATTAHGLRRTAGHDARRHLVFGGRFDGDLATFARRFARLAREGDPEQALRLTAISEQRGHLALSGALLFEHDRDEVAARVSRLGLRADALGQGTLAAPGVDV